MRVSFLPLIQLAIPYVLGTLDFLRSSAFGVASLTQPAANPYTPPFTGGQCTDKIYNVKIRFQISNDFVNYFDYDAPETYECNGRVGGVRPNTLGDGRIGFQLFGSRPDGTQFVFGGSNPTFTQLWRNFAIREITVKGGGVDNCGNLPNPNPAPPIASDGIADGASPNLDANALKIVEGAPLAVLPNFGAALLAALEAARQAANALDAIKSIADAIESIKDLLDKINEDTEDKDKDRKKDIYRYEFGSIRKDGFLRLYPTTESNSYKAEQIDINLLSIPVYYGKYFGQNSPNFYRFKALGYIAFVSPTLGIIEYKQIEFSRMSLVVPNDCIGFFYHLGLENEIVANVWGYYTQPQLSE